MSMTVSIRLAHKSLQKTAGQRRHDQRIGVMPKYVDTSRSADNTVIIPAPSESAIRKRCEVLRSHRDPLRKMKNTAAISTTGIITFSHAAQAVIQSLLVDAQNALYRDVAERITERLDTDLLSLAVHRDEAAPHAHFSMLAVNRQGIPISKTLHVSGARELQDLAGQVMAEHGLDITRGKSKLQRISDGEPTSTYINRTVKQLHEDLPADIAKAQERRKRAELEAEAAEKRRRKNEHLTEKARDDLERGKGDVQKIQDRLEAYERRIQSAEAEKAEREEELRELDTAIDEKQKRLDSLDAEAKKIVQEEKKNIAMPDVHNVTIKTGIFSAEQKNVVYEIDFRNYVRDVDSSLDRLAVKSVFAERKKREAEARETALRKQLESVERELESLRSHPEIAPILKKHESEKEANRYQGVVFFDEIEKTAAPVAPVVPLQDQDWD